MGLKKMISKSTLEHYLDLHAQRENINEELKNLRGDILSHFDSADDAKDVITIDDIEVMKYPTGVNTPIFNQDAASKLLKEKNLKELATIMVPVISQDKLREMLRANLISLEEFNTMFDHNINVNLKLRDKRVRSSGESGDEEAIV